MNGSIKRLLAGVVLATCSAAALAQGAGGGAGVGAGGGTAGGAAGINTARPPGNTTGSGYSDSGYGAPGTTATGGGMGTGTGAAPAPAPRQSMPSYNNDNGGMNNQPMAPNGGMYGSK